MNNKQKNIRDYAIAGLGGVAAVAGTVAVIAELPAIVLTAGGVVLTASAIKRLNKRDEIL